MGFRFGMKNKRPAGIQREILKVYARGGGKLKRRGRPNLGGSGGMLHQERFNFRVLETPFPAFFAGRFR